ncbi:hypothetical protein ACN28E_13695 [Archangium lansingense]|uniref:hypothetical protein n=1 Tax=Archangium lansingense TaxID=2995310 RepID=UPI003B823196
MRKSGWMLAPLAAAAVLSGCRSTACEDLAAAYADVAQKSQPCVERAPLPAFDAARCEQNLQACGGEDLDQLDAQVECYQRLGTCQPGQQEAFFQNITNCDSNVLSNTCEAAIF